MDKTKNNRILWVDIAKGIGIILVIIAHSLVKNQHIYSRGLIYSFHMPMFFILAGYTVTANPTLATFKKSIKNRLIRLLLPALVCYLITSIFQAVKSISENTILLKDFLCNRLLGLLFCEGMDIYAWNIKIPGIGMLWFFFVLFFSFLVFYLLHLIKDLINVTLFSILISVIGYFIIIYFVTIPFSFEIALLLLPFLSFGQYILPKIDLSSIRILLISGALWLILFIVSYQLSHSYFEIVPKTLPYYPICFLTAILGSLFIFCISKNLSNTKYFSKAFSIIGKNSLDVLNALFDHFGIIRAAILPKQELKYINRNVRAFLDFLCQILSDDLAIEVLTELAFQDSSFVISL